MGIGAAGFPLVFLDYSTFSMVYDLSGVYKRLHLPRLVLD